MVDPVSPMVAARPLVRLVDDIYDGAMASLKKKVGRWRNTERLNNLYRRINDVQRVKTIWKLDRPIALRSFYYPARVRIDGTDKKVSSLSGFSTTDHIVLRGIAGQGKSIFLRYLCGQELRQGKRLPIFFELRRYSSRTPLIHQLLSIMDAWGFPCEEEIFDDLAKRGKVVLLLDGFDELATADISRFLTDLEKLLEKYSSLQAVVTARPKSEIEASRYFSVYELSPLTPNDLPPLLHVLLKDPKHEKEILKAARAARSRIHELLTTPLLVTLLVFVYQAEERIPENFAGFYESLFPLLFHRHDRTKPGFVRPRSTALNEREMERIFNAFCFLTALRDESALSYDDAHKTAEKAIEHSALMVKTVEFLEDISKVTCLLVEEGHTYFFLHRSVQEYHAAKFVANRPVEFSIEFYRKLSSDQWIRWWQELQFLSHLDSHRYLRYFHNPEARRALEFGGTLKGKDFTYDPEIARQNISGLTGW